jgi:hypothetical protein
VAISVTNWVWSNSRSRHGARLVLLAIAWEVREKDDSAAKGWTWPSTARLAGKTGLSERAVQTAISDLSALGELEVQYNAGPKGCNRYRVVMPTPAESAPPQNLHPYEDSAPPQDLRGDADASAQATGQDPEDSAPPEDSAGVQNSTPAPEESAPEKGTKGKRSSPKKNAGDDEPLREDAERICAHLAARIVANGSKRPTITEEWRTAARLLLDKDDRTEEQVHAAIDWCQDSAFWCSKVMSMPKLRAKYDQLRLEAKAERDKLNGSNGHGRPRRRGGAADDLSSEVYGQGRTRI